MQQAGFAARGFHPQHSHQRRAAAQQRHQEQEATTGIAASGEKKANPKGNLGITSKDLQENITALVDFHHHFMTTVQDFEATTASRDEGLKATATAEKNRRRDH